MSYVYAYRPDALPPDPERQAELAKPLRPRAGYGDGSDASNHSVKTSYPWLYSCPMCKKPKSGGKCPDCSRDAIKKAALAKAAKEIIFEGMDGQATRGKHQNGFGKLPKPGGK